MFHPFLHFLSLFFKSQQVLQMLLAFSRMLIAQVYQRRKDMTDLGAPENQIKNEVVEFD
jgi:hypothetical protein